jgi:hypothetical protein
MIDLDPYVRGKLWFAGAVGDVSMLLADTVGEAGSSMGQPFSFIAEVHCPVCTYWRQSPFASFSLCFP